MKTNKHTSGPWKVIPCPKNAGKHAFHDTRWIATSDAQVEVNPNDLTEWDLESGSLICEMRDGPSANALLIAAAPDMLAALQDVFVEMDLKTCSQFKTFAKVRAAIEKATSTASY